MVIFNLLTLVYIITQLKIALNPDLAINAIKEISTNNENRREGIELNKLTKDTKRISIAAIFTLIWRFSGLLTSDWIIFLIYNIYLDVFSLLTKKKRDLDTPSYRTIVTITASVSFIFSTLIFLKNIFMEDIDSSGMIISLF